MYRTTGLWRTVEDGRSSLSSSEVVKVGENLRVRFVTLVPPIAVAFFGGHTRVVQANWAACLERVPLASANDVARVDGETRST